MMNGFSPALLTPLVRQRGRAPVPNVLRFLVSHPLVVLGDVCQPQPLTQPLTTCSQIGMDSVATTTKTTCFSTTTKTKKRETCGVAAARQRRYHKQAPPRKTIRVVVPCRHDGDAATTVTGNSVAERSFTLPWRFGQSLQDTLAQSARFATATPNEKGLDVSSAYDDDNSILDDMTMRMQGICGGQMGCTTCHVYLDEATFQKLPEPSEQELDMLDLAFEPKEGSSRLGCQVALTQVLLEEEASLDEKPITVTIPTGMNNVWQD